MGKGSLCWLLLGVGEPLKDIAESNHYLLLCSYPGLEFVIINAGLTSRKTEILKIFFDRLAV